MTEPIYVQVDWLKYETPAIEPPMIGEYLEKKLRSEWYQEEGDWSNMVEENEAALYIIKQTSGWSLEIVPLDSLLLDPKITNHPAFKMAFEERLAYQNHRLYQGMAIEPIVALDNLVYDGYHRIMALRNKGERFVLAYIGRG